MNQSTDDNFQTVKSHMTSSLLGNARPDYTLVAAPQN